MTAAISEYNDLPVIDDPDPEGVAYGVAVSPIAEDGEWIGLGHVDPLRFIAAVRKIARTKWRLNDEEVFGYVTPTDGPLIDCVEHVTGVFTESPTGEHQWYVWWDEDAQRHPRAVPITVWLT